MREGIFDRVPPIGIATESSTFQACSFRFVGLPSRSRRHKRSRGIVSIQSALKLPYAKFSRSLCTSRAPAKNRCQGEWPALQQSGPKRRRSNFCYPPCPHRTFTVRTHAAAGKAASRHPPRSGSARANNPSGIGRNEAFCKIRHGSGLLRPHRLW